MEGQMGEQRICERLNAFYSSWKKHKRDLWMNSDIILIRTGPYFRQPKPSFISLWLFGLNFPETMVFLTFDKIYFMCKNKKDCLALEALDVPFSASLGIGISVRKKTKVDDGTKYLGFIVANILDQRRSKMEEKSIGCDELPIVGYMFEETIEDLFMQGRLRRMDRPDSKLADITEAMSRIFLGIKNGEEPELNGNPPKRIGEIVDSSMDGTIEDNILTFENERKVEYVAENRSSDNANEEFDWIVVEPLH